MKNKKKGQLNMGIWWSLIPFVLVIAIFGLVNTFTADINQDIRDDYTAGTDTAYAIADASLNNTVALANKGDTFVSAGSGIFLLVVIIAGVGGIGYMIGRR